MDKRIYMQSYM
ncbi:hypothetical protein AB3S75_015439 [Citrus x aurantiifolia]